MNLDKIAEATERVNDIALRTWALGFLLSRVASQEGFTDSEENANAVAEVGRLISEYGTEALKQSWALEEALRAS